MKKDLPKNKIIIILQYIIGIATFIYAAVIIESLIFKIGMIITGISLFNAYLTSIQKKDDALYLQRRILEYDKQNKALKKKLDAYGCKDYDNSPIPHFFDN